MKNDPYFTKARFDSQCEQTGKAIKRGDEIVYYPLARKAFHIESKNADNARSLQLSEAWGV